MKIKEKDKKKYVLGEKRDFSILEKIYELEKCQLSKQDKKDINLIRSQLERDWRKPLIKFLNNLLKKYKR